MKYTIVLLISTTIFSNSSFAEKNIHCNSKKSHHRSEQFVNIDKNSNGKITLEEYKAYQVAQKRYERMFNHIDKNNNGVITKNELNEHKCLKRKLKPCKKRY